MYIHVTFEYCIINRGLPAKMGPPLLAARIVIANDVFARPADVPVSLASQLKMVMARHE